MSLPRRTRVSAQPRFKPWVRKVMMVSCLHSCSEGQRSMFLRKFPRLFLFAISLALAPAAYSQSQNIEAYFDEFTADWVRSDPDLATSLRYFSGEEQAQLERQMTPQTRAW